MIVVPLPSCDEESALASLPSVVAIVISHNRPFLMWENIIFMILVSVS